MSAAVTVLELRAPRMDEAVDVLCDAFDAYPVMRHVIGPAGTAYPARLRALMTFFTSARFARDELVLAAVDVDGTVVGVANVTLPGVRRSPADLAAARDAVWRDLGAEARARYEAFSAATAPLAVAEPHFHLNMLGVGRAHAGRGIGRALLDDVHARSGADDTSRGVTLTTEDPRNLPFYTRAGYAVTGQIQVASKLVSWGFYRPDPS